MSRNPSHGGDFTLCGWRVSSDFDLPELAPWTGEERPFGLVIRHGAVPVPPGHGADRHVHVAAGDHSLLQIAGVARYWLRGATDLVVDPDPTATMACVRLFLFGSAFGILCHQRRLLPLHASCAVVGDRAVAFAGHSGAGKSTLVAALARRGHAVVSDDVCVIEWSDPASPRVLPFAPRLKLTRESLAAVGLSADMADHLPVERDKVDVARVVERRCGAVPLGAVYHLGVGTAEDPQPLSGAAAVAQLNRHIFRRTAAQRMGREADLFLATARLAGLVPNFALARPADLASLADVTQRLVAGHSG